MKPGEIFASEGGYRLCTAIWGDDPIIDQSPWYPTLEKAEAAQARCNKKYAQTDEEYRARILEETGYAPEELEGLQYSK